MIIGRIGKRQQVEPEQDAPLAVRSYQLGDGPVVNVARRAAEVFTALDNVKKDDDEDEVDLEGLGDEELDMLERMLLASPTEAFAQVSQHSQDREYSREAIPPLPVGKHGSRNDAIPWQVGATGFMDRPGYLGSYGSEKDGDLTILGYINPTDVRPPTGPAYYGSRMDASSMVTLGNVGEMEEMDRPLRRIHPFKTRYVKNAWGSNLYMDGAPGPFREKLAPQNRVFTANMPPVFGG
ncbi:MAG: hypothetical protein NTW26_00360 [bacterium]|nr:hypothetical protein [bacterium]